MKTENITISKKDYQNRLFYTFIMMLLFALFMSVAMFTAGYEHGVQAQQEITEVSK